MLFSTLYNVVDTFYAGYLGTQAQAGMSVGFQAFFVLVAVGFGLGSAMSALIGNANGRKDRDEARHLAAQGLSYAVLATATMMGLALIIGPTLIALVSEPGAYRDAGQVYFNWMVLSLPGFILGYGGNGILQARGDTVSMQRALLVALIVNIGLTPLLTFGIPGVIPGIGFGGIALATVISQTGVALFILSRVFGRNFMEGLRVADFVPQLVRQATIARQAVPSSFALLITFASGFIVQFALKSYGPEALAAYGIALRMEQLFLLPALGITIALTPIAAQNFGAEHFDRVKEAFWRCCMLGGTTAAVAFPFLWFGGGWATSLFSDDPAVIADGALFLKVEAVILPLYVMLFAINSFLQAVKYAVWTMWIGFYRQVIAIAFFIWLLTSVFDFGIAGVRFAIALGVASGLVLSALVARHVARKTIGSLFAK